MDFGGWSAAVLATKWLLYAAVAVAIGAPASAWLLGRHATSPWRAHTLRQGQIACALGLVASAFHFFVLVGDFARSGLGGMLDWNLARMLWNSPIGTALMLRLGGFALIALAAFLALWERAMPAIALGLGGALALAIAFALGGHSAERGIVAQIALTLHVLAMACWLGALYPLLRACRGLERAALHATMERFGRVATIPVALLVACGALLIVLLFRQPDARLVSAWSITLGAKLLAVGGMLLLAALHRWRLVPQLRAPGDAGTLQRSIATEMLLAVLVLAATAALSTAFGPAGM